jgi:metallo-beta-lactamase family protein
VFVRYAAVGTFARDIVAGAKQVCILGEQIAVRARIYTINGFSPHAD